MAHTAPHRGRTHRLTAAVLVAAALLSACSDDDTGTTGATPGSTASTSVSTTGTDTPTTTARPDKSGNTDVSEPRTLVLSTISAPERPRGAVAARFAEELAAQGGDLAVDVRYGAADPVADFTSGAADMVLVPTSQLDTMGVDSFRALSMPLLIDDDDQADRVAADPVVTDMMAGLADIDATGLLFTPVSAIHLALQGDQPLRTLDQLEGGVRAVPESDLVDGVYEAMGTTAVHGLNDDAWDTAVQNGEVVAKEFPTALYGVGPLPVVMAANVTLYYDFEVLMIHDEALASLNEAQVDSLQAAAASAQQRSVDERAREEDAFRDECAKGADLLAAPITFWAEIGRAVDDFVLQQLEDPDAKATYDAIRRAAGQRRAAWPNDCRDGEVVPYEPPIDPSATLADGTYRVDGRSVEQMRVSGVGTGTATAGNEVDYWQLVVADGVADLQFHYADGRVVSNPSDVTVTDGVVTFTAQPGSDGFNGKNALTVTDDGFRIEPLPTDDPAVMNDVYDVAGLGLYEWTEVG